MDKLVEIMAWKRKELSERLRPVRERELAYWGERKLAGPSFRKAITLPDRLAVIAEIKRASPSAGPIANVDAVDQSRKYLNAGTDAISVLTDKRYFSGTIEDLWQVTEFLAQNGRHIPCLRKDFMVHPIQILEAAEAGARAILIIVRALEDEEIHNLYDCAGLAGLDCLFEVHSEKELDRALSHGAHIIGVNNRDLTRFKTDLAISETLLPQIPENVTAVSESGINDPDDAARVRAAGADAVLIGESLMREDDPEELLKAIQSV